MSIFVRLFLVYGLALTLGGALLLRDVQQQIRPGMKEVLEDTLADNAQALAAALAPALEHGDIQNPAWQAQLRARLARPQDIHIHQHHKTASRQQIIITAAIGKMRRELEDRAYVTRYIETLTHELKSPLTAISASAELLQDDLPAADRARFADNIAQQSARLHRLVQRLLQLSRIEKEPVHKQPLDLAALWHKHQREQQPRLAQKNLTLRLRHNGTDADEHTAIPLNADPFWLEQALANLLDNAMREAPAGSIITLAVSQNRQETRIALHNPTRAPVPDYALPRLFERYYTLNRKENSGLGLTLVAQIAEQHGGTACAENRDGGLTITLVLPA